MQKKVRRLSLAESLGGVETLSRTRPPMTMRLSRERKKRHRNYDGLSASRVGIEKRGNIVTTLDQALAAILN